MVRVILEQVAWRGGGSVSVDTFKVVLAQSLMSLFTAGEFDLMVFKAPF